MPPTALIVDDEPDIRELIALTLGRIGIDTHSAANLEEAGHLLERYNFDVCLTDMRLPDGNGLELVREIQETRPELPVAVITAHGNLEAAVDAMKGGAFDFVSKPVDIAQLRKIVSQALRLRDEARPEMHPDNLSSTLSPSNPSSGADASSLESLSRQPARPDPESTTRLTGAERLVGSSDVMQTLRKTILKVAKTNAPVWITGESGTGKELIARLIHDNGARAPGPFVAINCGAIPAELMESELFGHVKGSFTGAVTHNDGLFRRAEGGTLFLDEVAELPLHMQVKLLRAIQERSVRPVGGSEELPVDVRVLSASHEDLAAAVDTGRFRHDLYYRLNVISIQAPALRDRSGDIPLLAENILSRLTGNSTGTATSAGKAVVLGSDAMERLGSYRFPGNVRELENLLERAVAMSEQSTIGADDLVLRPDPIGPSGPSGPSGSGNSTHRSSNPPAGVAERRIAARDDERRRLLEALDKADWNRKLTADRLGMTYRQFRYRLGQLGIKGPGSR